MPLDTSKPFTRREALAAGITVHHLASPRFQRIFHGVYLRAGIKIGAYDRALAALTVSPAGSFISHHTAAELWCGWAPDTTDTHVTVPTPLTRSVRRSVRAHKAGPDSRTTRLRGIPVSNPVQVFLELAAAGTNVVDLVVAGDALVQANRLKPGDLVAAASTWRGKGARAARRAASLVRKGVDSAPESRLRMVLVLGGLPEPEVNYMVRTEDGEWARRFDLCYPLLRLIVEYDGRHHADDPKQWASDIRRREILEGKGWRIIVITAGGLWSEPASTLHRVRQALRDRGMDRVRCRTDGEWARLFPGRPQSRAA